MVYQLAVKNYFFHNFKKENPNTTMEARQNLLENFKILMRRETITV
jgi:hypothetical protein